MERKRVRSQLTVFTIGHSNHSLEQVLDLLKQHKIELVADVRSSPYARYAVHFNKEDVARALEVEGIEYRFLGNLLGGRPKDDQYYDEQGYVLYGLLAESPAFQQGVTQLMKIIESHRASVFCSEEDPTNCHRRLLIGRVLREQDVTVLHIRGDGRVQDEEQLAQEEQHRKTMGQMSLFQGEEAKQWKSTRSALRREPQPTSSRLSNEQGSSA